MLEQCITSFVDGRVRLRHEMLRNPALAEQVRTMLPAVHGIQSVLVNERTGSLLVEYDTEILNQEQLIALLRQWEQMAGFSIETGEHSPSCAASAWKKPACKVRLRRLLNGGMVASLAASSLMGLTGRTRGHILTGGLFLAFSAVHLWNVRKSL